MKYLYLITLLLLSISINAQQIFEQGSVTGGVTAAGFSTGKNSGSGIFNIHIEPGSTIKKAYLFTYRIGYSPFDYSFYLNNFPIKFDTLNVVSEFTHPLSSATPIKILFYDYTNTLQNNITSTFNVSIPQQTAQQVNWGFWSLFLYVVYENPNLPVTNYSIIVNSQDYTGDESYIVTELNPILNNFPIGFSLYSDRSGSGLTPNEEVYFNGNYLGLIGGSDSVNSQYNFAGVKGHFYYQNNQLFGLDDDKPNNTMDSTDGLANVASYVNNNYNFCNFELRNWLYPNITPTNITVKLAYLLTYTSPCDTMYTKLDVVDTTICEGEIVKLGIHGASQYSYEWYRNNLLVSNDTSLTVSPLQNQHYNIWIRDTNGCSQTQKVYVHVNKNPTISNINVSPTICADSTGTIEVIGATGGTPVYGSTYYYSINGVINTNIAPTYRKFIKLDSGEYIIRVTDDVGCYFEDTVQMGEYINTQANFYSSVSSGEYPLSVDFINSSTNADGYFWYFPNDTITTTNSSYLFDTTGTYFIKLIAWKNKLYCSDTISKQIYVKKPLNVIIPSVYKTSSGSFSIIAYTSKKIDFTIFNSIGQLVYYTSVNTSEGQNTIWNNPNINEGVFYYRIKALGIYGDEISKSGKILVVK